MPSTAGCGDDVLEGRDVPLKPEGMAILRRDLLAMRSWLGREWLCAKDPHPVRDLWQSGDSGAALELQSLAGAVQRIVPKASPGLARQWADGVKSPVALTMRTTAFEVYAAGLFANSVPVRTVKAKQPGYDFAADLENGTEVRVSCKSREASEAERQAAAFALQLRKRITETIPRGPGLEIRLTSPSRPTFDVENVLQRVRAAVRALRYGDRAPVNPPDTWQVAVTPILPLEPSLEFHEDTLSFSLLVIVTLDYNRIVDNFRSRLEDGLANLQTHSSSGPGLTNLLLYRLPQQLAIADAETSARDVLAAGSRSHIASIFFYRAGFYPRDIRSRASFYLGHEWYEVRNERAITPLANVIPATGLKLRLFGGEQQLVEPVLTASKGETDFPLAPGLWMRLHGEHNYRMPDWSGRGPSVVRPFGLKLTFWYWHQVIQALGRRTLTEETPGEPVLL